MSKGFVRIKKALIVDKTNVNLLRDTYLEVRFSYHNQTTKYKNNIAVRQNVESIFIMYSFCGAAGLYMMDFLEAEKDGIAKQEIKEMYRKLKDSKIKFYVYPSHVELNKELTDELEKKGFEKHFYADCKLNLTEIILERRRCYEEIEAKYGHLLHPGK
jgi:hypothetical protein